MDELGIATVVLVTGDIGPARLARSVRLRAPRRPVGGDGGARRPVAGAVRRARARRSGARDAGRARAACSGSTRPWVIGSYLHTHSWDRRLDHADLYPFYAACADAGVPVAAQAGTSGGLLPERVRSPDLGRPSRALLPRHAVRALAPRMAVGDEAVAMALKFPNVYLGTGAYPPRHWPAPVVDFLRGPGRTKVMFAHQLPDRRPSPRAGTGRGAGVARAGGGRPPRRYRPAGVHDDSKVGVRRRSES